VPEVLSPLRPGDAPGSAPGCSAQGEGIFETGVAAKGWEAGQVNARAHPDRLARWLVAGLLSAVLAVGCVTVTESPSRAVKIANLVSDPTSMADSSRLLAGSQMSSSATGHGGSRSGASSTSMTTQVVKVVSKAGPTCGEGSTATVNGRYSQRDGVVEATWVVCSS
jgi:hypothetical protein